MTILNLPLLLLLTFFCILSCSTHSSISSSDNRFDKITFGSGGGFTGIVKSYSIDKEGNLVSLSDNKKLGVLTRKELKQVFKKATEAEVLTTKFEHPGNFYYFIEVAKADQVNRIVWSDKNKTPERIISFYQYLVDLTKPYTL